MRKSSVPFPVLCKAFGLPEPMAEFRFHPGRRWRFDWVWLLYPTWGIALEVEGGAWTGGRHTRGSGYLKDMEKYNEAALRGWMVLRCTPQQIHDGSIFPLLARALGMTCKPAPGLPAASAAGSSSTRRTRRRRAAVAGTRTREGTPGGGA